MLRKSVSMFMLQDYKHKELWILNNHEEDINAGQGLPDNIKIFNLGFVENIASMHNKALRDSDAEFICIWEDDDLYLPWHLSNITKYFEEGVQAIKPTVSISLTSDAEGIIAAVNDNYYEAAHIVHATHLRKFGFGRYSNDDPEWCWHWRWLRNITNLKRPSLEDTSYVYIWGRFDGLPNYHTSGGNINIFRENSHDTGEGAPLEPVEITSLFEAVEAIRNIQDCPLNVEAFLSRLYSHADGVLFKKEL